MKPSIVVQLISAIKKLLHAHHWETTHTNRWMHPTRQECRCGLSRTFKWRPGHEQIKGMPWDKGHWVWSDGTTSDYDGLAQRPELRGDVRSAASILECIVICEVGRMFIFSVRCNTKYNEFTIEGDAVSMSSGLLDDVESVDLAKLLISAAEDLLPSEYSDEERQLAELRESI